MSSSSESSCSNRSPRTPRPPRSSIRRWPSEPPPTPPAWLAGDFFERVPAADCYLLANVPHDWDDQRSIEILHNCRKAMRGAGRILIIERLIPEDGGDPLPTLLSDINMLVLTGGLERTNPEYGTLLQAAGLRLGRVLPVAFPYGVIESVPA